MIKKVEEIKFKTKEIYFTGAEIFYLNNIKKMFITEEKGNFLQRSFNEWDEIKYDEYIKSIKNNFPHSPFYCLKFNDEYYIVDGQHRLAHIVKNLEDVNKKSKIPILWTNLFKFIIIETKAKSKEEVSKIGGYIFRILNDESVDVKDGAIYKALMNSKNSKASENLYQAFTRYFKTAKTKKFDEKSEIIDRDKVYDILGLIIFTICIDGEFEVDWKLGDKIKKKLETIDKDEFRNTTSKAIEIFKQMNQENFYPNKKMSENALPTKNYMIPLVCLANYRNDISFRQLNELLIELYGSNEWKDSSKKSRSPGAFKYSVKTLKERLKNPQLSIIEAFNNATSDD